MDYIMIRAWGSHMGSAQHYIRDQVAIAKEDKAPGNAIYKHDDGTWATIDDIANPTIRSIVDKEAARIQKLSNPDTRTIL